MAIPENLKYTESHEWCRVEGDVATVGITEHAVHELGDLVYLDLPEAGAEVKQNEAFGEVESVKAVSDLKSPVSGKVAEVNTQVADDLASVSSDPYEAGWLIKVTMTDTSELDNLMDAAAYKQALES